METSIVVTSLTAASLGVWYLRANRAWSQRLTAENPRLAYDPGRDPLGWVTGSRLRMATWLARMRSPDHHAEIESWRVKALNRFVVWVGVTLAAFLAGDGIIRFLVAFVQSTIQRYGSEFGTFFALLFGAVLGYYLWQLARSIRDFGNGRRPTLVEVGIALGGIGAALVAMAIMPTLDLAKALPN